MATDDVTFVYTPYPIDLSGVRDQGMQALITLAASLGWRVHQKPGQPVVLTAEDGVQKRLPTDTSIRMSVFQTALSSILVHTEPNVVPTIELVDAIIGLTKPSVDHQRRLRLALGESPAEHRERVANSATPPHRPDPRQEHLVQHIEIPTEEPAAPAASFETADGEEHGDLLSREPTRARRSASPGRTDWYQSDTSYERHWSDGYVDFECMICGKPNSSSRGVGAHSQVHDRPEAAIPAWKRAEVSGTAENPMPTVDDLEWEEPAPTVEPEEETVPREEPAPTVEPEEETVPWEEPLSAEAKLDAIIRLIMPATIRERDSLKREVISLTETLASVNRENEKLQRDWQALKDLIGGG